MPVEQNSPFTVSYHSAADARIAPAEDVLENRLLHLVFVITHIPVTWPGLALAAGLLLAAVVVWLIWLPFSSLALTAAIIYMVFALTDWVLLWWLPKVGYSFGPIGPQLFLLTAPRIGAAVVGMLLVLTVGETIGLWAFSLFQLAGSLIYLWGKLYEPFALNITHMEINSPHLPSNLPPLRLLHLSDLHVERLTHREAKLLALVEQAQPDLIVITGDYLNLSYVNDPTARSEVRKLLEKLSAPYGVYATLGSPPVDPRDSTPSLFDGLNIRLLRDEVAIINLADGRTISLIGLDCEHEVDSDSFAFRKLIKLPPPDSMRIFLYHSPELMPLVQQHPVELYLCGHTHGGQVRMPFYGAVITSSVLGKQYEMGAYVEQDTTLYISRGIGLEGMSIPRMRLLCQPEIILFSLGGGIV